MSSPLGLPGPFRAPGSSSFVEFLAQLHPERLRALVLDAPVSTASAAPHGTTIVGLRTADGIVLAGDRRATMGNLIAQHDIEKVFVADEHSAIGIAGTAGLAVELVRLFQVELEHYEKIEGLPLSLDGKANRLSTMLRGNLGLALQGLAVVPLFGGYDLERGSGRIFSYDVTGGRYEEHDFYAVGSGSVFARGSLKKLYDAADDDSATGGPDAARGIYPVVAVVEPAGARLLGDEEVAPAALAMLERRRGNPDGGVGGGAA